MSNDEFDPKVYAGLTINWIRDIGAEWRPISDLGAEVSHFTVYDWAKRFDLPTNEETNSPTRWTNDKWQETKIAMMRQGYEIAIHPFRGHFKGEPGDQATNIIVNVQTALALLSSAIKQLEAIKDSGEWENVQKKMVGKVMPDKLKLLLDRTPGVCPDRYYGIPSESLKLLMSGGQQKLEM